MTNNNKVFQKGYWEKNRKRRMPWHPVIEAFVCPKIDLIKSTLSFSEDTKVLDVGCGNGFFGYYFSKFCDVTELDYSRYMLSRNPCNSLVQGSALSLPFKNGTFNIVFCLDLLHHIKHPIIVLREMKRVSKKFVILSEPNRNNPFMLLFSMIIREEHGTVKFSLRYMKGLVQLCELKIIASCTMGSIVPNKTPLLLLKWFQKINWRTPFGFTNVVISHKWKAQSVFYESYSEKLGVDHFSGA